MSDSFMEALGADDTKTDDVELDRGWGDVPPDPNDVDSQESVATETQSEPPAGLETPQTEAPNSQQTPAPEPKPEAVQTADYWRGRYEALAQAQGGGNGAQAQPPAQPPGMSDEEKARIEEQFLEDPYGTVSKLVSDSVPAIEGRLRMQFSIANMRREKADYDEVIAEFQKMAKDDESLDLRLRHEIDPARFAYNFVQRSRALKAHDGDPEKMREAIRAEERAKIRAELEKEGKLRSADDTPPTPAGGAASGGNASVAPKDVPADALADNPFDR